MPVHSLTAARKRRAVEFRSTPSARDMLLGLPIARGNASRDLEAAACATAAWKGW